MPVWLVDVCQRKIPFVLIYAIYEYFVKAFICKETMFICVPITSNILEESKSIRIYRSISELYHRTIPATLRRYLLIQ